MRQNLFLITMLALAPALTVCALTGCEEKRPAATTAGGAGAKADNHDHGHGHAHAAEGSQSGSGHGGAVIALGEQTIGSFSAKATRDQGEITAGKDAPIDVTVTPAPGSTAKAVAVRFWIGTKNAKGSVKAKAAIEDPKDPSRWHVHVEIPDPLPPGSRVWVEIEDDKGGSMAGSFDLKA